MSLSIVTPSYIDSEEREKYARKSLNMLNESMHRSPSHIVVDDFPRIDLKFGAWLPNLFHLSRAKKVYNAGNTNLIRQWAGNNTEALLRAVKIADKRGSDLVFIHLDDNVYIQKFGDLLENAIDAFQRRPSLKLVRFTDTPVLSSDCTEELGNRTQIQVDEDTVRFEEITFSPQRYEDYTLWTSPFHADIVGGQYHPIPMWFSLYRTSFLRTLLETFRREREYVAALTWVEKFYKDKKNWRKISSNIEGEFGYINMQFGGLEMQWNENWEELVSLPNEPVR
ncbi:hypothetical protein [Salinibacter ruber]|uniref:hypothetical protein n=1 Tax=Salinibacter ruber TaxID=146919 RepID=UPI0021674EA9|nr:hypothetical protein [Salinibacter ruber]MCS3685476.1 hypothetical protein [Salinibacter ruber]